MNLKFLPRNQVSWTAFWIPRIVVPKKMCWLFSTKFFILDLFAVQIVFVMEIRFIIPFASF